MKVGRLVFLSIVLVNLAVSVHAQMLPSKPSIRHPLAIAASQYRLRAGDAIEIPVDRENREFLTNAKSRSAFIVKKENRESIATAAGRIGSKQNGFVFGPDTTGDHIMLAAPLTMAPGAYTIELQATSATGENRNTTLSVVLDPVQTVPSTATKPPVVLLNGWQLGISNGGCPISNDSSGTFGNLAKELNDDGVPAVYFFDNCVECPNCKIEDLGNDLGQVIGLIKYDNNNPVSEVDLVGHSMGGLIARDYLAGLQPDESVTPPTNPRVRKLIEIATPNFGSYKAPTNLLGDQTNELVPGNAFLWNLATWNQGSDDLRGVDALAIIGNAGSWNGVANASDGVVSLSSGSLTFARDQSRTRILPYCHVDSTFLANPLLGTMDCSGKGIAAASDTAQLVLAFLDNRLDSISIGKVTPNQDPLLSQYGGIYFAYRNAEAQWMSDLTQVSLGSVVLQEGYLSGEDFYTEFVKGTGSIQATSTSQGILNCGTGTTPAISSSLVAWNNGVYTVPAGRYDVVRCKTSPLIYSVGPILPSTSGARIVSSGSTINISGTGFGSSGQIMVYPGNLLQVSSWTDTSISAILPSIYGGKLVTLEVDAANGGKDYANIMTAAIATTHSALNISKTHVGNFMQGQTGAYYTLTVSNASSAGPTSGMVTVSETVPAGLSLVSMSGTGWNCAGNSCTRNDVVSAGSSYPPITVTVNVASDAPPQVTNQVSVSGAGSTTATASDLTNISPQTSNSTSTNILLQPRGSEEVSSIGPDGDLRVGYATATVNSGSTPYGTAVFSYLQNGVTVTEVGVPAAPPTQSARLFEDYRMNVSSGSGTIDINTGIAVANPGASTANIKLLLRDLQGKTLSTGTIHLAAHAHLGKFLDEFAPDFILPSNFPSAIGFGSVELTSDQPISVVALRLTTNQRGDLLVTTTPVADLSSAPTMAPLNFPELLDGGGYQTTLVLLNTSNEQESGTIKFTDDSGAALNVVVTGNSQAGAQYSYQIPPGGAFHIITDGSAPSVNVGWAQVVPTSGSSPVGAGVFSFIQGGILAAESGIPSAIPTTHARIYVDTSNGHDTGVTIANTYAYGGETITVKAYNADGVTSAGSGTAAVSLPKGGHAAKFADQLVPGLPQGFTGVLDISSSSPFVALTLRTLINSRGDFVFSTFPTADVNRPAPAPIVFPELVAGGGYQTQFILLSTGASANVTLKYFAEDGSPLPIGQGSGDIPALFGVDTAGTLVQINTQTGTATPVGATGFPTIMDVAFTPDGSLYGIACDPSSCNLIRIDTTTGAAVAVGDLGNDGLGTNALTSDNNGTLFGATQWGDFVTINPMTGVATKIGSYGSGLVSSGDLAFGTDGTLFGTVYGYPSDLLVTVNTATGQATVVGTIGYPQVYGLDFSPDGTLFGAANGNSSWSTLITIDPKTAKGSTVGYIINPTGGINGLSFRKP